MELFSVILNGSHLCKKPQCTVKHRWMVTGRKYVANAVNRTVILRSPMNCYTTNLIYILFCSNCGEEYIGSTNQSMKDRSIGHLSEIRCNKRIAQEIAHFNASKCCGTKNDKNGDTVKDATMNVRCIPIEWVGDPDSNTELEKRLMTREQWWQASLNTIYFGLNGGKDWHSSNKSRRHFSQSKQKRLKN